MSEVKRFDLAIYSVDDININDDGKYVYYKDYQTLESKLKKVEKALMMACERLQLDCPAANGEDVGLNCGERCNLDISIKQCWYDYFFNQANRGG